MKRYFLSLLLLPLSLFAAQPAQPNIILFLVDDMGLMDTSAPMLADDSGNIVSQPLNAWYRTPNMERLAKKGIRFSPHCLLADPSIDHDGTELCPPSHYPVY